MIAIELHEEDGRRTSINTDAIAYISERPDRLCYVFITDGEMGELVIRETYDQVKAKLKEAGEEILELSAGEPDQGNDHGRGVDPEHDQP